MSSSTGSDDAPPGLHAIKSEGEETESDEEVVATPIPADDKGKQKESEELQDNAAEQRDDVSGEARAAPAGPESAQRRAVKAELEALSSVHPITTEALVSLDPTPVEQLDPITKLMKAIALVQTQFQLPPPEHSMPPYKHPNTPFDDPWTYFGTPSSTPPPQESSVPYPVHARQLNVDAYTELLKLLSSTLSDVVASSRGRPATAAQSKKAEYDLTMARFRFSLQTSNGSGQPSPAPSRDFPPPPTPPLAPSSRGRKQSDKPLEVDEARAHEIALLFAENSRLALLKLQPNLIARPPAPSSANPTPSGSCYIAMLPPELLVIIFRDARRSAGESRVDNANKASRAFGDMSESRYVYSSSTRPTNGTLSTADQTGSRTLAQRWCLSLALVCKDWRNASRSVAYSVLHLRRKHQLPKLLTLLSTPGTPYADSVVSINVKIPPSALDSSVLPTMRGSRARYHVNIGAVMNVSSSSGWSEPDSASAVDGSGRPAETPGELFSKLVALAPNLQELALTVLPQPYAHPFGGRSSGSDFLEPNILQALSTASSLKTLSLGSCIDFEDLEILMLGLPNLQHLCLDGGFDDVNGQGAVISQSPHVARLRSLVVGTPFMRDFTDVTEAQLAWLLEPAIATLSHIDLTVNTLPLGVFGGLGGFGGGGAGIAQPPCFASASFANALIRMGGQLDKLSLRELQPVTQVGPALLNAPHNGSFDHALSHCTRLRELTIHFTWTGAGLLTALDASPSLESLVFLGPPSATSAIDFALRLEGGEFPQLKRLVLSGQYRGAGVHGFRGTDLRKLKEICAERNILCVISSQ